jgi:hypothetical protein
MKPRAEPGPERMNPAIALPDPAASHWVAQAVLRLRRELAWVRHLGTGDAAQGALDLLRHDRARAGFFATDPAAAWLGACLAELPPPPDTGVFARLAREAGLAPAERFALGLALAARLDGALAPVFAAAQDDAARPWPTVALAQRLWDDPLAVLAAADATRPLIGLGLIAAEGDLGLAAPLEAAGWLARLVAGAEPAAFGLRPLPAAPSDPGRAAIGRRLAARPARLEIVPLLGPAGAEPGPAVAGLAAQSGRPCLATEGEGQAAARLRVAWLAGADLMLSDTLADAEEAAALAPALRRASALPLRLFLRLATPDPIAALKGLDIGPVVALPATDPATRAALIAEGLGARARRMQAEIDETARDHRLEPAAIARLTAGLTARPGSLPKGALRAAARAECHLDFHGLAEEVRPRFGLDDIVLPPAIARHFREVIDAVASVGRVHHDWGGAEALAEGGVAVLSPGCPAPARPWRRRCWRAPSTCRSTASTSARWSTNTSARPRRTSGGSSTPPSACAACSSSTRPTRSSASAPRCATPTTASPTSRPATCCSAWSASPGSPSSPATAAATSTRPSPAGCAT